MVEFLPSVKIIVVVVGVWRRSEKKIKSNDIDYNIKPYYTLTNTRERMKGEFILHSI